MKVQPKILLLITKSDVGGAQVHVLEILKWLKKHYQFTLAAGEEDYLTTQARRLGIDVVVLKHLKRKISFTEDRAAYKECVSLLKRIKPDLLHSHSSKAGVIGRLAAWRTGVPSLFTAHGWVFTEGVPWKQRLYGLLIESLLCRLVGETVTISEYDYHLAERYHVGARSKCHLIRNGISSQGVVPKSISKKVVQILSIGRLTSTQKNQGMLLEALARLDIEFHAEIIGEGENRAALEKQISELMLHDKVSLLGETDDASPYLINADIFVLSSNYEGLPLSILEAMSIGLPVVATDVGGVNEAVLHQKTGLLSERGDVATFADNIKVLALDASLRTQFGENGRLHYEQNFTIGRMVKDLNALYAELLES